MFNYIATYSSKFSSLAWNSDWCNRIRDVSKTFTMNVRTDLFMTHPSKPGTDSHVISFALCFDVVWQTEIYLFPLPISGQNHFHPYKSEILAPNVKRDAMQIHVQPFTLFKWRGKSVYLVCTLDHWAAVGGCSSFIFNWMLSSHQFSIEIFLFC